MNECFGRMQDVQVDLMLDMQGAEALEDGKKEYQKLEKLVKGWKVKASEPPREKSLAPANNAGEPTPTDKETVAVDTSKEVTNVGAPVSTFPFRPFSIVG